MIYADTSLLVALYALEPGTEAASSLIERARAPLALTPLHTAEWMHAMAQKLRLRALSPEGLRLARRHWAQDQERGLYAECDWPGAAWQRATEIGLAWGGRLPARTLDTLHVAAALELGADRFWTLDANQATLARRLKLRTGPFRPSRIK